MRLQWEMDVTFCKYNFHSFTLCLPYASLRHILLDICKYLIMQSLLWQMVRTKTSEDPILDIPSGSARLGCGQAPHGSAPPPPPRPPVSPEQLLAMQNDLMRRLVENNERREAERQQPRHQERDSSYSNFLATHPLVFVNVTNPLEAESWLHAMESKFRLLHCIEYQKTMYAA
jgi:hypothetical protein